MSKNALTLSLVADKVATMSPLALLVFFVAATCLARVAATVTTGIRWRVRAISRRCSAIARADTQPTCEAVTDTPLSGRESFTATLPGPLESHVIPDALTVRLADLYDSRTPTVVIPALQIRKE
jgi:hypothetical protein